MHLSWGIKFTIILITGGKTNIHCMKSFFFNFEEIRADFWMKSNSKHLHFKLISVLVVVPTCNAQESRQTLLLLLLWYYWKSMKYITKLTVAYLSTFPNCNEKQNWCLGNRYFLLRHRVAILSDGLSNLSCLWILFPGVFYGDFWTDNVDSSQVAMLKEVVLIMFSFTIKITSRNLWPHSL